ncbi:MAG: hypothetical protein AAF039_09740 [Bacteroidota bacterium]
MIIKRLLFAAVLVAATTNYSCGKEDVSETEQTFEALQEQDQQAVKKSEIDDGDT